MIPIKTISVEEDVNVYYVGDIHGRFDLLTKGITELGIKDSDVIVSVGDLVDRSHENLKCILHFTTLPNRYMVMGNHDDMMIKGITSEPHYRCWMMNGGHTTFEELGEQGLSLVKDLFDKVPYILEVNHRGTKIGVIHGGIPPKYPNVGVYLEAPKWESLKAQAVSSEQFCESLVWDRESFEYASHDETLPNVTGVDWVIHGHTFVATPLFSGNRVWCDTGAVFNNKLTFMWQEGNNWKHYTTGDYDEL